MVFLAGAVLVAQMPLLRGYVNDVLDYARFGSLSIVAVITLVNGLAEELFFRGALFSAVPLRHQISISTLLYMLVTVATGNVMLVSSPPPCSAPWSACSDGSPAVCWHR